MTNFLRLLERFILNRGFPRNVTGDVVLGRNVRVKEYSTLDGFGGRISIGDDCVLAEGVKILSLDGAQGAYDKAPISIGKNVFIGTNAIILPGGEIGDNSIIGAGSVVLAYTKIPANEAWAGVPARKIGESKRGSIYRGE